MCLCVKTIIEPLKFKGYLVSLKIDSSFKIYDIDWELPIKNISQHQYYAFSLKILAKIQFLVCSGIGLLKHLKKRLKAMKNHWRTKSIRWTTVSKIILLIRCENERIYQCRVSNQEPTSEFLVAIEFLTRTAFGSIRIYSLKSLFGWRFLFLQQFFIHLNLDRLNLFAELFYHSKHHLN